MMSTYIILSQKFIWRFHEVENFFLKRYSFLPAPIFFVFSWQQYQKHKATAVQFSSTPPELVRVCISTQDQTSCWFWILHHSFKTQFWFLNEWCPGCCLSLPQPLHHPYCVSLLSPDFLLFMVNLHNTDFHRKGPRLQKM